MKIEDPHTYIEKLLSRDDGFNPTILRAKELWTRGKTTEAIQLLATLPDEVLSLGCKVAHPAKRGELVPDQSAIPDFIKAERSKSAKKPAAAEEKKK